jgi:hypothetical protein
MAWRFPTAEFRRVNEDPWMSDRRLSDFSTHVRLNECRFDCGNAVGLHWGPSGGAICLRLRELLDRYRFQKEI